MFATTNRRNRWIEGARRITLALLLIATMLVTPFPRTAQAAPARQIEIIDCNALNFNRLTQRCGLGFSGVYTLEDQVIGDLLSSFGLPASDRGLLLQYEGDLVRAALFDRIMGAVNKDPAQRTLDESDVVRQLTNRVQQRRITAATFARDQYNAWAAAPCVGGWQPPRPFPFYAPTAGCTLIGGLFTRPKPPSFETFQQYGAAHAYRNFNTDAALQTAAANTAKQYANLAIFPTAVIAGGIGLAVGGSVAATTLVAAIFPFATVAGTSAVVGAAAFAGAAAIVIIAVVAIVLQFISVFADGAIPGQLNDALLNAQITPDLRAMAQPGASESSKQEIFSAYIEATVPVRPITTGVPAADGSVFQFQQVGSPQTLVESFTVGDWSGATQTVRGFNNWFIIANSAGVARYSLDLEVLGPGGVQQTVWRKGSSDFVVTNGGQIVAGGTVSSRFGARRPGGSTEVTVGIPQLFVPGPAVVTVLQGSGAYSAPWATEIFVPSGSRFELTDFHPTIPDVIRLGIDSVFCGPPNVTYFDLLDVEPSITPDGVLSFTTHPTHCGRTRPRYVTLRDATNNILKTTELIIVVNSPPVAVNDTFIGKENTLLTGNVLANDTDAEGAVLNSALSAPPAHGTVTLADNGSFVYTPTPGYNGPDSFTYRAGDGIHVSNNIATVSISIRPANEPPVAVNDSYTVAEDTVLTVATPGVLANDSDPEGGALNAGTPSDPAHGTATIDNLTGRLVYTPDANYHGPDSFTYLNGDGVFLSNLATVSINVTPVNDAPVANNDRYTTNEDTVLTVAAPGVLANDTDADPDAVLNAGTPSDPAHGTATINNLTGVLTYTPDANYSGPDSFT